MSGIALDSRIKAVSALEALKARIRRRRTPYIPSCNPLPDAKMERTRLRVLHLHAFHPCGGPGPLFVGAVRGNSLPPDPPLSSFLAPPFPPRPRPDPSALSSTADATQLAVAVAFLSPANSRALASAGDQPANCRHRHHLRQRLEPHDGRAGQGPRASPRVSRPPSVHAACACIC